MIKNLIKNAEQNLTSRKSLRVLEMSKSSIGKILSGSKWKSALNQLAKDEDYTATGLLKAIKPIMDTFCPEPEEGWLKFMCDRTVAYMYPDNFTVNTTPEREKAVFFFMENYRAMMFYEKEREGFDPVDYIELLPAEETERCVTFREYERMKKFWRDNHIYEFLRISREITPYNTAGHIGGVHYVATFIGRQFIGTDIPIDIGLVSGAAACHDLGKYGCTPNEEKRIPYLHYYYTDQLLKRERLPMIAHIASNHSTWDLELENLSIESLLLIYADFRVKSIRENGVEKIMFYTLDESFNVILNKLDNVDEEKRQRYERVYSKLKDFENYMINIGVETDIFKSPAKITGKSIKKTALLMGNDVVEHIKYTAIEHNIKIMSIFNNEAAFGSLLEEARSEKQWKNLRAYLNILSEYFTYMTKHEKMITIHFLYEILSHREGDIRRQAGYLIGTIIASYDDIYRKEIPESVNSESDNDSINVWKKYLNMIVFPDYKSTEQHRNWIWYTLKSVLHGLIENADKEKLREYLDIYFSLFDTMDPKENGAFVLLDSVITLPKCAFTKENLISVVKFAAETSALDSIEVKISALRVAGYSTADVRNKEIDRYIDKILLNTEKTTDNISVAYLTYKVLDNIGYKDEAEKYSNKISHIEDNNELKEDAVSKIFRENLKVGTPWIVKTVNIDFLLESALSNNLNRQLFHLAAHFSNLIKVSEKVTVRHRAGRGLIKIADKLPIEQINEIVIELTKGLEIGEYQFSKYIPEYLGELALYLYPSELDEFISTLSELIESNNAKVGSVALDTVGEVLKRYSSYRYIDEEVDANYTARKYKMLSMLLKGLANYHEAVSQEAFLVIGQYIFGSEEITNADKFNTFKHIYKKMLTLVTSIDDYDMNFFTNAAALNHIYRFISEYRFNEGNMELAENNMVAFFPGTFDPFSLSHKGIVKAIRKEGFEVYLALDEFSWSKKTQPRKIRRKIISMSVADETGVFLFPDDFPVNIANPKDLKCLKELFPGKELYMVVGSDVITNASSYKKEPEENSIHSMNHVVFRRETLEEGNEDRVLLKKKYQNMTGNIKELTLPVYLEDISSTRIRENIDKDRDISNLIDPVAQSYIYDNSLYLREPQYKNILETKDVTFSPLSKMNSNILNNLVEDIRISEENYKLIKDYIDEEDVETAIIKDKKGKICAFAAVNEIETGQLYQEFKDHAIASYLRKKATGRMLIIRSLYCSSKMEMRNLLQIILTEVLAEAIADDVTYAIYHPIEKRVHKSITEALVRQGFAEMPVGEQLGLYEVNMKEPIAIIQDMDTVLKSPFNTNPKILNAIESAHKDMQMALTKLNPGNLVLSFNAGVMHHKIVDMVTASNNVPNYPLKVRKLGDNMCVPFGKILKGMAVPNTVTKTLHTEKVFTPTLDSFTIEEYPMYSTISNQIKTIKSFGRPVILVDDLLHKGYRMKVLDSLFNENELEIKKIITGLLSGHGKDLMDIQGREVESAYFVPNLKTWFVESAMCPFIGGDGVKSEEKIESNLIPSINLILPFAAPGFIEDASNKAIYELSKVCISNAEKIFKVLEREYQNIFERKLTIKRLSDAIISPRMPNGSNRVAVDINLAPSVYMADYMERLIRLESVLK